MRVATCTVQKKNFPKFDDLIGDFFRKCVTTSAYLQLDSWKKVVSGSRAPVTACIYNCDVLIEWLLWKKDVTCKLTEH